MTATAASAGDEGTVITMPAHGQPEPDPYRLLGVTPRATPAEISQAWRRKARAEHPDARPWDAAAPARFRALAEAYQMLSDPARRAAYDQAAAQAPAARTRPATGTPVRVTVLSTSGPPVPVPVRSPGPGVPLRAGPVHVEPPGTQPARGADSSERARLRLLAELAARFLDDWPW